MRNLPLLPRRHSPAASGCPDLRLAVVSPFVDRRHGTERCLAEQLVRFASRPDAEIHLYAQHVEDLSNVVRYPARSSGCIVWHRVPRIPGPHLFGYIWWFLANRSQRWWDRTVRGLKFDLLYSAGINASDADAMSVHVIFHQFYRLLRSRLTLLDPPISLSPLRLHRSIYYGLISLLGCRIYPSRRVSLTTISAHSSVPILHFFGREHVPVIRHGA